MQTQILFCAIQKRARKKRTQRTSVGMRADRLYSHIIIINAYESHSFIHVLWNEMTFFCLIHYISATMPTSRQFSIHLFAFELAWCFTPNDWLADDKFQRIYILHHDGTHMCNVVEHIRALVTQKKALNIYITLHQKITRIPYGVIFMQMHSLNVEHWTLRINFK